MNSPLNPPLLRASPEGAPSLDRQPTPPHTSMFPAPISSTASADSGHLGTDRKTALVVDDARAEQRLIAALLKQMGMAVEVVDSGEAALAWLMHQTPDLMVLDVVMPGMSGFDLCRQLKARPETAGLPVILCTSKDQEFDRFWGLRQGASVYLTKPFAPQDLITAVTSCLA